MDFIILLEKSPFRSIQYTYKDVINAIKKKFKIIRTPVTRFCNTGIIEQGYRLLVYVNNEVHEITLGRCEGTDRIIRQEHNLENLLLSGEFDWFQG